MNKAVKIFKENRQTILGSLRQLQGLDETFVAGRVGKNDVSVHSDSLINSLIDKHDEATSDR